MIYSCTREHELKFDLLAILSYDNKEINFGYYIFTEWLMSAK